MVYDRMADYVRALGRVSLKAPVKRVFHDRRHVTGLQLVDGRIESFDHVISTMPLTHLVRGLDGVPQNVVDAIGHLTFRNTILAYLHVDRSDLFQDQWIYVHDRDLQVGRVTNFRNWVPQLYGQQSSSILALEYWCYDQDQMWSQRDEELIKLAEKEIRSTGLVGDAGSPPGTLSASRAAIRFMQKTTNNTCRRSPNTSRHLSASRRLAAMVRSSTTTRITAS